MPCLKITFSTVISQVFLSIFAAVMSVVQCETRYDVTLFDKSEIVIRACRDSIHHFLPGTKITGICQFY